MEKVSRRAAMRAATAGAVVIGTAVLGGAAAGDEPKAPKLWTLEGELKVHPKFLYRYYIVLLDGQKCALYGSDHGREPDQLARVQLPAASGCAACWGHRTTSAGPRRTRPHSPRRGYCTWTSTRSRR